MIAALDRYYLLGEGRLLLRSAELEELLDDVIAKDVGHEGVSGREDLLEHKLLLVGRGSLQFLLNETRSVLILAELHYVISQVTKLKAWESALYGFQLVLVSGEKVLLHAPNPRGLYSYWAPSVMSRTSSSSPAARSPAE
jgi:hypothetical protein